MNTSQVTTLFLALIFYTHAQETLDIEVHAQSFEPMRILCALEKPVGNYLPTLANTMLTPLLEATRQFKVVCQEITTPKTKQDIEQHARANLPLALFLSNQDQAISWHLYDTFDVQHIKGAKINTRSLTPAETAIVIADQLWPELTSQKSSFKSLLAACKQEPGRTKKRPRFSLQLMHPFLSTQQCKPIALVTEGSNLAPRWHPRKLILFYSHHTPTNVRLMALDQRKQPWKVTSFDGQNLTPTISAENKTIMVISGGSNTKLYEYTVDTNTQKRTFVCLTPSAGDFISPAFINNHELVFCHINEKNVPHLGILDLRNHHYNWLDVGAALSPAVSPDGSTIAFCKKVNGVYQLFTYNLATKQERKITTTAGHVDECSWSPCGNFIACAIEDEQTSRIGVINIQTGAVKYLTPIKEYWSYPRWSPTLSIPFGFK